MDERREVAVNSQVVDVGATDVVPKLGLARVSLANDGESGKVGP